MEDLADIKTLAAGFEQRISALESADAVSIIVFSGEWDRLFAAFTIANGALAMDKQVHMFFTFWGATAIRSAKNYVPGGKNLMQKMLFRLLPADGSEAPLSRFHFCGVGKWMIKRLMKAKGVEDLSFLIARAVEMGIHVHCCDTSLQLFGWCNGELMPGDATHWCGVTTFLAEAMKSRVTLFI